ncbi:MAG: choice-of-anchor D domain-containing protein, partial [Verrucomicrobiales bacterium]|nr:choice-of-anchor D domain-containing protein [Verrucomicrobiales bacterium]
MNTTLSPVLTRSASIPLFLLLAAVPALANTYTVTHINDSGAGSLRQAILDANANPGLDNISFNIPGTGPHTIAPSYELPFITNPVVIDGYTQPGASANTLSVGNNAVIKIQIDGVKTSYHGLILHFSSDGSTIRGLAIYRFPLHAIEISSWGCTIAGNYIGTDATGTASGIGNGTGINAGNHDVIGGNTPQERNVISSNYIGISLGSSTQVLGNYIGLQPNGDAILENNIGIASGVGCTIGGASSNSRNVISGNRVGIHMNSVFANSNVVIGNYIGTDATGTQARGNLFDGVLLEDGPNWNRIGGTADGERNIISGNGDGIHMKGGSNNLVQGNYIGTDVNGTADLGNDGYGVLLGNYDSDTINNNTTIGGAAAGAGNRIAFNTLGGVRVLGVQELVLGNAIFSNGGLGIDIGLSGVTANDPGDGDTGAVGNSLQNYPVLTSALIGSGVTTVTGLLNSTANTTFTLEFFSNAAADPSGYGEGETFQGSATVTTDGSGNASFTFSIPVALPAGQFVSATASDPNNNTSEFSQSVPVAVPVVEMDVLGNSVSIADGDVTPSASDHTDFGSANTMSGSVDRVFTIANTGIDPLNLTGSPLVQITGANAADFSVTVQPASPVAASGNTTFTVHFDPSAVGLRSATISIANDDVDENPYDFAVQGTGTAAPEMNVLGNSVSIADGDLTPSSADHTDFGSADISSGSVDRGFTIANLGSADLNLTGSPKVQISGPNAADFSVTVQPSSPIAPNGNTTFTVHFDPSATGVRSATISIANNDPDENPYNFSIQGTGSANTPPTISATILMRTAGAGTVNSTIANVSDADQAADTLSVTVNGASSASVNGVTVSGLIIDAGGVVAADVEASASAVSQDFTLRVTDSQGAAATATLVVIVSSPACAGGALPVWNQQAKNTASDGAAGDVFGWSVGLSGDTAIVGAHGFGEGQAYIFTRSGGVWTQQQILTGIPGAGWFGFSVALSGDTAIVGAPYSSIEIGEQTFFGYGAAYVFTRSGGVWTQQQKLTDAEVGPAGRFGWSVGLSGDTAIVGAYLADRPATDAGSAYVFTRSDGLWTKQQRLGFSSGGANAHLGFAVALSGDTAIVGSDFLDTARVFTRTGGVWTQQQLLTSSDGVSQFGRSLALSGDTAIIGAPDFSLPGSAYVFTRTGGIWTEQQKLTASDAAADDNFGWRVAINGDAAIVGAPDHDTAAGANAGSAYVFTRSGGVWTEQQKLTASDGGAGDRFGFSVALSGDAFMVGAYLHDTAAGMDAGSSYLFIRNCIAQNTPPTITAQTGLSGQEGSVGSNSQIATVSDAETAAGSLTVTITSANPSNGVTLSNLANTDGTITADIVTDCGASDASFILEVSDGSLTATATLNITITSALDPVITAQPTAQTVCVGSPVTFMVAAANAVDYQWRKDGIVISGATGANFSILSATETDAGSYDVVVAGSCSAIESSAATLTVNPVNNPPIFTVGPNRSHAFGTTSAQSFADGATGISDGDPEVTQALTFNVINDNPALLTATPSLASNGTLTYTPNGTSGTATVSVTLTDDDTACGPPLTTALQTFTITVSGNTAPTISDLADQTINEDAATSALAVTVGDAETPAGSLTLSASSSNTALVPDANIVLGGTGASRTVSITPVANQNG